MVHIGIADPQVRYLCGEKPNGAGVGFEDFIDGHKDAKRVTCADCIELAPVVAIGQ